MCGADICLWILRSGNEDFEHLQFLGSAGVVSKLNEAMYEYVFITKKTYTPTDTHTWNLGIIRLMIMGQPTSEPVIEATHTNFITATHTPHVPRFNLVGKLKT